MRVDTNPFFTRASQYIEGEYKFIKLFSPEILNVFKNNENEIWGPVKVFRSSPGGGKTTLLKIFTSKLLKVIKDRSNHDNHNKDICDILKELNVYDDSLNLRVAGSLLSFNNEYVSLEYLNTNESHKIRLFFSLLNTRIIIAILQSIATARDLKFPHDLELVKINVDATILAPNSIKTLSSGLQFYNWASELEKRICEEIDSIYEINTDFLEGSDNLFSLDIFAPLNIQIGDTSQIDRILVMLDDVHNLTTLQRQHLFKAIIDKRPLVNLWISERLKALTIDEIFSEGSKESRDIVTVELEDFWANRHSAFERFAKSVADRRVKDVLEDRNDFSSFLSIETEKETQKVIAQALEKVKGNIVANYGQNDRYKNWISSKENQEIKSDLDRLIAWRSLEILLYRDKNKAQQTLGLEILEDEELEDQEGSDVRNAALLFLNKEFGIPYYYGISNICKLASFNIEQFLMISGQLFDDILTSSIKMIVNPDIKLEISPSRQEEIIRKTLSKKKYSDVLNILEIRIFLDAIGGFCQSETYVPNAWNSPGINGIAITMKERSFLKDTVLQDPKHVYYPLAKCLATCLTNNLLDFKLNYRCKGKDLMIIYLNKIYCVKYNLPLNNGKFKERNLKTLLGWMNNGFNKSQKLDI